MVIKFPVIKRLLLVGVTAFILHLIWEYAQCGYFFDMEDSFEHQILMITATLGDMNMAIFLYLILSASNKSFYWIDKGMSIGDVIITVFYSLFMSFYFETRALIEERWVYSEQMPLIYGTNIGVLPVIQLLILFPLGFYLTKYIISKWK